MSTYIVIGKYLVWLLQRAKILFGIRGTGDLTRFPATRGIGMQQENGRFYWDAGFVGSILGRLSAIPLKEPSKHADRQSFYRISSILSIKHHFFTNVGYM